MTFKEPWSKKHKKVTGGTPFSFSNSFTEPLTSDELIELSLARGDHEIVDQYQSHSLNYTPNGGSEDLREEIANLYNDNISAENILVFAGGQVGLQTAAFALLDEDSHAIVFGPGYQSVQVAPVHAGSQVTQIRLYPENNWQIDMAAVKAAIQENTKYIVINEPFNPAGTLMSKSAQMELKNIAKKHDIFIMSDEAYRLLEHDIIDRLPAMAEFYDKGISCCAMSKPWGGCGITIGWLALQDMELKQKIIDVQYFGTACPSRASEIQAMMALKSSNYIIDRNLTIIKRNLALLDKFVDDYSDLFEWVRPTAGAIGFMKFNGPLTSNELGNELVKVGISIKPAYVFGDDITGFEDYFRIGFGEDIMPKALDELIKFVENNKEEWRAEI